ncbi:hypothetical protein W97_03719 [Coniosporium apollinis CBS 100218]|uniref:Transcription factor CBF/NF-Y/archaeal histone domain-containing protein n=1 Tax=Coniosporium apollinis (strain CBS 100218) TaxID=1168221 RepID=R7YRF1_CONA1|nr:uncharacterized protein W97_03719 [Coniosporium apollinis CBS 100218]EON64487.1 hypothetical protein W97_03719 [Coniosporium apollinis CBS 100218]
MESPGPSWAPQSPDLSGYHFQDSDPLPALPAQHQTYRGSISHTIPYTPTDAYTPPKNAYFAPRSNGKTVTRKESTMEEEDADWTPEKAAVPVRAAKPRATKKAKIEASPELPDKAPPAAAAEIEIEIKTKFPVARIKRIMQADEEVGKVAQVTPHVVSKALELFMIAMVSRAAGEAKSRGSKRITLPHLKQTVVKEQQYDFLLDTVSKVADAPAVNEKSDPDDPAEGKKKRGSGRRKRKESEDL